MEAKDWIILIVPILINGTVLFIFQKIYSSKLRTIELRQDYRIETIREFHTIIKEAHLAVNDVLMTASRGENGNEVVNILHTKISELVKYYRSNINVLNKVDDKIKGVIDKSCIWVEINNTAKNGLNENQGIALANAFNETKQILIELDKWCLKL